MEIDQHLAGQDAVNLPSEISLLNIINRNKRMHIKVLNQIN